MKQTQKIFTAVIVIAAVSLCLWQTVEAEDPKGKLYVVGIGPAGPDLAAPRALDIVKKADVILCSPGMPDKFNMFGPAIDPAKVAFNPWENLFNDEARKLKKTDPDAWRAGAEKQKQKVRDFVLAQNKAGKTVAMIDGGDACVYGPTLNYLLEGFDDAQFEVIPGMGAVNAAAAALKRSLTPEGVRFVMLTSPQSLFGENGEIDDDILKDLAKYDSTMVWYMSLKSLDNVVKKLSAHYPPDLPIAIVYYAGYPGREKVLRSRLGRILEDVKHMDEKWLGLFIAGQCAR
jgi:precorrin-4 methylase